jgi:hypothetical protein
MPVDIAFQHRCQDLVYAQVYNCLSSLFYALTQDGIEMLGDYEILDFYTTEQKDPDNDNKSYEVYEQWAVSEWLGDRLREEDETVREFFGLQVWLRCGTGQALALDPCIEAIQKTLDRN